SLISAMPSLLDRMIGGVMWSSPQIASVVAATAFQQVQHRTGAFEHVAARSEDSSYTLFKEEVIVLTGYDTTTDDNDVLGTLLLQLLNELGNERLVASGERGCANDVHPGGNCHVGCFLRR